MQRLASLLTLGVAVSVAACGPSPKPKPATASIETDGAEPESTEWLYATPDSSGELELECKLVADAIRGEQNCSGDLCQHGTNLADDWLRLCPSIEKSRVNEVKQLATKLHERRKVSGGECAYQGEQLIANGCPAERDCAETAQQWATTCASHTSPLVVRMIERQVARNTQKPIRLDTTPCPAILERLTASAHCGNEFECAEKLNGLRDYQARCVQPKQPQPLDDAVRQATLLVSGKQPSPAILVQETRFAPEKGKLLLADGSGYLISVGERPAPNVNLFIKAVRDSEFVLEVMIARIFNENGQRFLRVGALDAQQPETFFRRYPSLEFAGQRQALDTEAANTVIAKLNEVVKYLRDPQAGAPGFAAAVVGRERIQDLLLGFLLTALADAAVVQDDEDFLTEVRKADKHLVPIFERLAAAKRAKLPKNTVRGAAMRDRVAYARRAWAQPTFDVTPEGQVELGAANPAVLADIEALLPVSFAAYRNDINGSIGKALRKLEGPLEAELQSQARSRAELCAAQRRELGELERTLLACSFGIESCPAQLVETTKTKLDDTAAARDDTRIQLAAALASLEAPPEGNLAQLATACRE